MVISDHQDLGSLFRRKKKKAPAPKGPPNTNFNFPMPNPPVGPDGAPMAPDAMGPGPASLPGAPVVPGAPGASASAPKPTTSLPPTLAPTMAGGFQEYLPWIIGGTVLVLGGVLVYIYTRK